MSRRTDRMGLGREIVLLAIGAAFGLGVALVSLAIPTYLPNFSPLVPYSLFWGGLAIMAIMITNAVLLYLWWDQGGAKLGPALLINLGLCLVAAGFVWHYAPPSAPVATGSGTDSLAKGTEVASARLSYDGTSFKVISHSAEIKSLDIKATGLTTGLLTADRSFTFQVAFFSGYGPFDYSMMARDNSWPGFTDRYWTINITTETIEDSDNFVEFRITSASFYMLPLNFRGPTEMRLSFRKR